SCRPNPDRVNTSTECRIVVKHVSPPPLSSPTGIAKIFAQGANAGQIGCQLKKEPSFEASCKVHYTPTKAGRQEITARYLGDSEHAKSDRVTNLDVSQGTTQTTIDCNPNPVRVETETRCTVVVKDVGGAPQSSPTGTVKLFISSVSSGSLGC